MTSKIPDNVKNPKLYKKIKAKIRRDVDKKNRQWGAYDSGRLVKEYKAAGGKYSGKKSKNSPLSRWYKEKWINVCKLPKKVACGRPKIDMKDWKKKFPYCRPSVRVTKSTPKTSGELSKKQIASRCKKKKSNPSRRVTSRRKSPKRKSKSRRRKSPKRKSKSRRRKSPKRKSKSRRRKSPKRKSKSPKRKSPKR